MEAICPIHNEQMFEREGKYGSFWSHKTEDSNYNGWCSGKPPKNAVTKTAAYQNFEAVGNHIKETANLDPDPDWIKETDEKPRAWSDEEKSKQITRLTLAKSFIQANSDFDNAVVNMDLEKWVDWIFSGEIPQQIRELKNVPRN